MLPIFWIQTHEFVSGYSDFWGGKMCNISDCSKNFCVFSITLGIWVIVRLCISLFYHVWVKPYCDFTIQVGFVPCLNNRIFWGLNFFPILLKLDMTPSYKCSIHALKPSSLVRLHGHRAGYITYKPSSVVTMAAGNPSKCWHNWRGPKPSLLGKSSATSRKNSDFT
jgi:hypothetical protein